MGIQPYRLTIPMGWSSSSESKSFNHPNIPKFCSVFTLLPLNILYLLSLSIQYDEIYLCTYLFTYLVHYKSIYMYQCLFGSQVGLVALKYICVVGIYSLTDLLGSSCVPIKSESLTHYPMVCILIFMAIPYIFSKLIL